jgi:hypothetical protein
MKHKGQFNKKTASKFGSIGGSATATKLGSMGMSEIGKKGLLARWSKNAKTNKTTTKEKTGK